MTKTKCSKYCWHKDNLKGTVGEAVRCEHGRLHVCYQGEDDFFFARWMRLSPVRNPFLYLKARKSLKC